MNKFYRFTLCSPSPHHQSSLFMRNMLDSPCIYYFNFHSAKGLNQSVCNSNSDSIDDDNHHRDDNDKMILTIMISMIMMLFSSSFY